MKIRALLLPLATVLGCASRPPDGEELGQVEQAITCVTQTLVASKTYKPSVSYADANVTLPQAHGYVLPSTVSVTAGNSANGSIKLTFSAGCGAVATCTYLGGSTQAHPTTKTELTKAAKYNFQSCSNGVKSGGTILADRLSLHVIDGDGRPVAWNLVAGVHDSPTASERTVWEGAAAREVGPVDFAEDLSAVAFAEGGALEFEAGAVRARDDNLLLFRSRYEQPFGTFRGTLPGGVKLAEGYGVMERHVAVW